MGLVGKLWNATLEIVKVVESKDPSMSQATAPPAKNNQLGLPHSILLTLVHLV